MDKILSSPQMVQLESLPLDDMGKNHQIYLKSLKDTILSKPYEGAALVKAKSVYKILDHTSEQVAYYMEWRTRNILNKKAAYQILVWSNPKIQQMHGRSLSLFFELLFKENDLVCTDRKQTAAGRRLWLQIITVALNNPYYVYCVDMNKKPHSLIQISSLLELNEIAQKIWTSEEKGQANLVLISKEKLPERGNISKYPALEMILKKYI